jgi:hypothetical protein
MGRHQSFAHQVTANFKPGHCDFQNLPLGSETGQYRTAYRNGSGNRNNLRIITSQSDDCACPPSVIQRHLIPSVPSLRETTMLADASKQRLNGNVG